MIYRVIISALILLVMPATIYAQTDIESDTSKTNEQVSYRNYNDDQLLDLLAKAIESEEDGYDCAVIFPVLDELLRRSGSESAINVEISRYKFLCALQAEEWPEVYQSLLVLEKELDVDIGSDSILFAYLAEQYDDTVERILLMAEEKDSKAILEFDKTLFWEINRELFKLDKNDLHAKLANGIYSSPHFNNFDTTFQSAIVSDVLFYRVRNKNFDDVEQLIVFITSPYNLIGPLTDKNYKTIWPQLEAAAGKNLSVITGKYKKSMLAKYKEDETDRKAFQEAAHALHFNGDFYEAIKLVQTYDHSNSGFFTLTEDDAWAMNIEAYSLDGLGRTKEAMEILDKIMIAADNPESADWIINFAINRASYAADKGLWEAALEAAAFAQQFSKSDYAQMLIWRTEVCAYSNLKDYMNAQKILNKMTEKEDDAEIVFIQALICAGQDERAGSVIIKNLNDDNNRILMLASLQKTEFELFYNHSILPSIYDRFKNHPEVQAELKKQGRLLPDTLLPLVGLKRAANNKAK